MGGRDFPHISRPALGTGAQPASCTMGTRSFPGVKSGRGVTLTPHPLLVPWSWKSLAIPLLPLWAVRSVQSLTACTRETFTFTLHIYMYINICIYIKYLVSTATCFSASASTVGSIILGMLKLETHYNTSNHNPIKAVYRCCVINLQMSLTHASCCLVAARAVWRVPCWCL